MSENGRGHKHDYGIKGYDPKNKKPTRKSYPCPYCNIVVYGKSAITNHINGEHWDLDI